MALQIPVGVILIWGGTDASVPSGWIRTTSLDGKYPKGFGAVAPNITGGATSHTHAAAANHSHTMDSHTHDYQLSDVGAHSSNSTNANGTEGPPGHHSHSGSLAGVVGGDLSSVAATYDTVSNDPPYREVIFIEPDTVDADLVDDIVTLWNSATPPSGWVFCDGSNDTLDMRNRFIKGATGAGDAGASGGSTQNVHPLTHTHVESSHTHTGTSGGAAAAEGFRRAQSGGSRLPGHTHAVTLNATTAGGMSAVSLTTAEVVEPPYTKVSAVKNNSGAASQPQNIIGLWLGTEASIPDGWVVCDGDHGTPNLIDKYPKIISVVAELGNTGGANSHTHASQQHTHTGSSHTHTGNNTNDHTALNSLGGIGGNMDLQDGGAAHTFASISNSTVSWAAALTQAVSASNEPEYRTVIYIMFTGTPIEEDRAAEITGTILAFDVRRAQITGITPAEERAAEIQGMEPVNDERNAEISGLMVWTPEEEPIFDTDY